MSDFNFVVDVPLTGPVVPVVFPETPIGPFMPEVFPTAKTFVKLANEKTRIEKTSKIRRILLGKVLGLDNKIHRLNY